MSRPPAVPATNAMPPHSGVSTHHQDQLMVPVSLSTMSTMSAANGIMPGMSRMDGSNRCRMVSRGCSGSVGTLPSLARMSRYCRQPWWSTACFKIRPGLFCLVGRRHSYSNFDEMRRRLLAV
jgi:hypothetical protein